MLSDAVDDLWLLEISSVDQAFPSQRVTGDFFDCVAFAVIGAVIRRFIRQRHPIDGDRRRIHAVWFVGLAAFTTRLLLELLATLPPWLPVGRALIRPFI